MPPSKHVESIYYSTGWKTASVSRAQRDLAHLIRLCPNLKRLRLDGVCFHLPSFSTVLTKDTSLLELRLENLASHIWAEDINVVLASQPKLKSFRLISDLFEEVRIVMLDFLKRTKAYHAIPQTYVVKRRGADPLVKRPCPELVSLTLSNIAIPSIKLLLDGCELPALKQADICLPTIEDGVARPYDLDFLSVLPKSLAELRLTEEGRCYDPNAVDWHKVATSFPQLKQLRSNLATPVLCAPKAPFSELVNLTLVYPRPSPLSFLRCLKDETCTLDLGIFGDLKLRPLFHQGCPSSQLSASNAGVVLLQRSTSPWMVSTTSRRRAKCQVYYTSTRSTCWMNR